MANTRDSIGEEAALSGLINRTLETFEEDGISYLGKYALYYNKTIKSLKFPRITKANDYCCNYCSSLTDFIAPNLTQVSQYAFGYDYELENLQTGLLTSVSGSAFTDCHKLSYVDLSALQKLDGSSAFNRTLIGKLVLPECTSLQSYCTGSLLISDVDLPEITSISSYTFSSSYNLTAVIFRKDRVITKPVNVNTFGSTPINNGIGYIYVPSYLVDSYKENAGWSSYAEQIVSIDEYPKQLQNETISDTWQQIFAAEANGTYADRYHVGDTKCVRLNGANVLMQIVGIDKDIINGSNNRAKITWITCGLFLYNKMRAENSEVWSNSYSRSYMVDYVYPLIDETVRNNIKEVRKITFNSSSDKSSVSAEKIWIPSYYEMLGTTEYEFEGVTYSDFFTDAESRKKKYGLSGQVAYYQLRTKGTHSSGSQNMYINSNGIAGTYSATSTLGICFGFCT